MGKELDLLLSRRYPGLKRSRVGDINSIDNWAEIPWSEDLVRLSCLAAFGGVSALSGQRNCHLAIDQTISKDLLSGFHKVEESVVREVLV